MLGISEITVIAALLVGVLVLGPKYIPKIAWNWRRAAEETKDAVKEAA